MVQNMEGCIITKPPRMFAPQAGIYQVRLNIKPYLTILAALVTELYAPLKEGGSSGFNALFGGSRSNNGDYYSMGGDGFFWSSTEGDLNYAWFMTIYSSYEGANIQKYLQSIGRSVRCLQD
jgi:hypothetical protein